MGSERVPSSPNAFHALQQFARRRRPDEQCELCGAELPPKHRHLIDPEKRKLSCACEACALLFSGQAASRYKRVPTRVLLLNGFHLTDAQWEGLRVPINMAFFFKSSPAGKVVALYPSPAGATESLLELETWDAIVAENPVLRAMEPDVEGLLVNRIGVDREQAAEYFVLPIDECFKLVGLVRMHWRGFSGGVEVWQELERHFAALRERSSFKERAGA